MPRIAPLSLDEMAPELRELLATRPPYAVYRVMANAPTLLPGFMQLASAVLTRTELDPQLREMVILRVGAHCRSAYEIHQHERLARHVGVSDERISKALDTEAPAGGDALEDVLLAFTDSVVLSVKAPEPQYRALEAHLSPRAITELLLTIGTYMMVSRLLENLEVEIEQDGVDIGGKAYYPAPAQG